MTDATGVAGAEDPGDLAVGSNFAFGDLANQLVDLGEEGHMHRVLISYYFFLPKPSMARRTSTGTAKTTVFDWSELISLIELRVRR